MQTKRCKKCGEQPIEKFYQNSNGYYRCAHCSKEKSSEYKKKHKSKTHDYYIIHKEQRYAQHLSYINRNQIHVANYLEQHPCVDCGEKRIAALDFDHIIDDKRSDICTMIRQALSIKVIDEEIAKCEVRCSNCHRVKTANQHGWFRSLPLK